MAEILMDGGKMNPLDAAREVFFRKIRIPGYSERMALLVLGTSFPLKVHIKEE